MYQKKKAGLVGLFVMDGGSGDQAKTAEMRINQVGRSTRWPLMNNYFLPTTLSLWQHLSPSHIRAGWHIGDTKECTQRAKTRYTWANPLDGLTSSLVGRWPHGRQKRWGNKALCRACVMGSGPRKQEGPVDLGNSAKNLSRFQTRLAGVKG